MGNPGKVEIARYTHNRFQLYLNYFLGRLFFNSNTHISTKGMGRVADYARCKARGMINSLNALGKTGVKVNIPFQPNVSAYATLEKSKNSSYDYWCVVCNLWEKSKVIRLPMKSHKALNKALKNHWQLSEHCEFKWINGEMFVFVFVNKEVDKATAKRECIGVDVGINKSVSFSDGYIGESLKDAMMKAKESQKERYRQRTKFNQIQRIRKNYTKTRVKQILDREAKELVARCKQSLSNAVVESRKVLSNLSSGRLNRWARCYFANRVQTLCKESSIFFLEVNPFNSSRVCHSCGNIGERDKEEFVCQTASCPEYLVKADADTNAAKVLRGRGHAVVEKYFSVAITSV